MLTLVCKDINYNDSYRSLVKEQVTIMFINHSIWLCLMVVTVFWRFYYFYISLYFLNYVLYYVYVVYNK